jgi:L-ascorbate metabolism protein UlaG (beta-lactamase superfamily)
MQIQWYGQSSFRLTSGGKTVAIDPFGDMSAAASRGIEFNYPAIEGLTADLLLVTHEHGDHNGVEVVGGAPVTLRSTAGTFAETPVGEVVGIASEHDPVAGTQRGPNVIFVFTLDGVRVAHFGDFGQSALRPEQAAALGSVDLAIVPVGGGPTIGADLAYDIAQSLGAKWVIPMHYRTERTNFLEPADDFLAKFSTVSRVDPTFDLDALEPGAVVPAAP